MASRDGNRQTIHLSFGSDCPNISGRLFDCPAWKSLSANASKILLHIWRRYNGSNNGYIHYAVRDAEVIGIGKNAAMFAIAELRERGFLKLKRDSSFHLKAGKAHKAREYEITALMAGDQPPSKDYVRWRPGTMMDPTLELDRVAKERTARERAAKKERTANENISRSRSRDRQSR